MTDNCYTMVKLCDFPHIRIDFFDTPCDFYLEEVDMSTLHKYMGVKKKVFNKSLRFIDILNEYICMLEGMKFYFFKQKNTVYGIGAISLNGESCKLCDVAILQGYRGNGYSKRLLYLLLKQCYIMGCNKIMLKVYKSNVKAIRLYEKFGFFIVY